MPMLLSSEIWLSPRYLHLNRWYCGPTNLPNACMRILLWQRTWAKNDWKYTEFPLNNTCNQLAPHNGACCQPSIYLFCFVLFGIVLFCFVFCFVCFVQFLFQCVSWTHLSFDKQSARSTFFSLKQSILHQMTFRSIQYRSLDVWLLCQLQKDIKRKKFWSLQSHYHHSRFILTPWKRHTLETAKWTNQCDHQSLSEFTNNSSTQWDCEEHFTRRLNWKPYQGQQNTCSSKFSPFKPGSCRRSDWICWWVVPSYHSYETCCRRYSRCTDFCDCHADGCHTARKGPLCPQ